MELKNGKVYFSSASNWQVMVNWLKKKGKRPTNEPWIVEFRDKNKTLAYLVQTVEEIPKINNEIKCHLYDIETSSLTEIN